MSSTEMVEGLVNDPSTPTWLLVALEEAMRADPVDAANAAEVLYQVLLQRCDEASH